MTCEEFWGVLKVEGFTFFKRIEAGGRRRVLLQSREGLFPSVDHPGDFTPEQREEILARFLSMHVI